MEMPAMHGEPATRRSFLLAGSVAASGLAARGASAARGQGPEADDPQAFPRFHFGRGGPVGSASDRGKLTRGFRAPGLPPVPVMMPDLPEKLPWKMVDGVKEYHLVAEVVRRELLPGMEFFFWGYNGTMPGPLIEAVRGDRIRIVLHNRLPEPTTLHLHGLELPNALDGVEGLTQDPIPPGASFAYELDLHQDGSFFYHSHGPMQEIMGMTGMFVIHPPEAYEPAVDHDFALIFHEFAILPNAAIPNAISEAFNFFTINGRSGPLTTPLIVRHGSRVRVRLMNLSAMDHHPIHLHGHTFWITGGEAGRFPEPAWVPRNTTLVGVAQVQDIEFIANNPGDWVFHCHILHHMMNHMTSMTGPMSLRMRHDGALGGMGHPMARTSGLAGEIGVGRDLGLAAIDRQGRGEALGGGFLALGRGLMPGVEMDRAIGRPTSGPALDDDNGPAFGHGLGPQTTPDHAERTGPPLGEGGMRMGMGHDDPRWRVPGFPLDMMDMKAMQFSEADLRAIRKPETRGMRSNWFLGVEAMMTVVRVLPDDLYEKVVSGQGEVPAGASVPPLPRRGGESGHAHEPQRG
jgi:FtsP/CotA-like multicopper oxidase with cupredoxin domain